MMKIQEFLEGLEGVKLKGSNQWSAHCPNHDDSKRSLEIKLTDDNPNNFLVNCFAGCDFTNILDRIRTSTQISPTTKNTLSEMFTTVSLEDFQNYTKIPLEFLKIHMLDSPARFQILDCSGRVVLYEKIRTSLTGKGIKYIYKYKEKNQPLVAFGIHRLEEFLNNGLKHLIILEGETDSLCCWMAGFAAIGPPGVNCFHSIFSDPRSKDLVRKFDSVWICREPEKSDEVSRYIDKISLMIRRETDCTINVFNMGEYKDPLDCWKNLLDITIFKEFVRSRFRESLLNSKPRLTISLSSLSQESNIKNKWLWKNWIPRGYYSMLAGDPGVGKSFFSIALGLSILPIPGMVLPPGFKKPTNENSILIIANEDSPTEIYKRFKDNGATDNILLNVSILNLEGKNLFINEKESISEIYEAISEFSTPPSLIVLDPLSDFVSPGVDINDQIETKQMMKPLSRIAREFNLAFLVTHHLRKSDHQHGLKALAGSFGIYAGARSVLSIIPDPERKGIRLICHLKANHQVENDPYEFKIENDKFSWIRESKISTQDALAMASPGSMVIRECMSFLRNELKEYAGNIRSKELLRLAETEGYSRYTIQEAKVRLGCTNKRIPAINENPAYYITLLNREST